MVKKSPQEGERRPARERLLAAADALFYEAGIHTVGIDRVIERAGVAKASLYDCFGSKDELVRAYLAARQEAREARLTAWLERCETPRDKLLGVFDALADYMARPDFRGCAFTRAASEALPGSGVRGVCDNARGWTRELFTRLARDAGAADAPLLARQLVLLYDGAQVSALMEGGTGAATAARQTAQMLLDGSCAVPATGAATTPERAPAARKTRSRSAAA